MLDKLQSLFRRRPEPVLSEAPFIEAQRVVVVRGAGFCKTEGCENYNKSSFIWSQHQEPLYVCGKCKRKGYVVKEEYSVKTPGDMTFWQVRVEYEYRPSLIADCFSGTFHGLAIVSDTSMSEDHNVYTLKSPLIGTEKRALAVATATLGGLLQDPVHMLETNPGSRPQETIIDFDKPLGAIKGELWELEEKLRTSRLTKEFGREAE